MSGKRASLREHRTGRKSKRYVAPENQKRREGRRESKRRTRVLDER
jgi:hypothetical protein